MPTAMKVFTAVALYASFLYSRTEGFAVNVEHASGNPADPILVLGLSPRALPDAPDGYTPLAGKCPSIEPSVRSAAKLSPNESSWLQTRREKTASAMYDLLGRLNIDGFDAEGYILKYLPNTTALPNVAIAASGGGYRAMLNAAGAIKAFDSREENTTSAGQLGGLLQSATYLAGLSGGGWLVGSVFVNNFTTISDLQRGSHASSVWQLENSVLEGPKKSSIQILDSAQYFGKIVDEVHDKEDAGFATSITDYWGRGLSFQFINATNGGDDYTWSSIQMQDSFASGQSPMPILIADGRAPGQVLISSNTTLYEFNPFEFGSWDPTVFGFIPLEFLGTNFTEGSLAPDTACVRGFDNAGFVMGTSSSLFNQFFLRANQTSLPNFAKSFLNTILRDFGDDNSDIANYSPNPFYKYGNSSSRFGDNQTLTLVDGGEDNQNIPLHPLIQPDRSVDVIFAIDSSADTSSWPNGSSLVATYQRSVNEGYMSNGTTFPSVPDPSTFINLGLNARPTFFGCNTSNFSSSAQNTPPLIVYLPNSPYVYLSNFSTFTLSYNNSARDAIISNGYAVATMGNSSLDAQWPACVGCAILSRSLERTKTQVPKVCLQCFEKFCWDGTVNSTTPAPYEPGFKAAPIALKSGVGRLARVDGAASLVVGVLVATMVSSLP